MHRLGIALIALSFAAAAPAPRAAVSPGDGVVEVSTSVAADSVTVGQRFSVTYRAVFPDSLAAVTPEELPSGTCRALSASWSDARSGGGVVRTGHAVYIPLSLDSAYVPAFPLDFVAADGDTLRVWTDAVEIPIRLLATQSKDLKPLKEQWVAPRNWWPWIAGGALLVALAAAAVWWLRRRRRRVEAAVPEVRLPPDFVALKELERIAAMGLVERGEFKTFYTLVADAVRRYIGERFSVEALDRTTRELLDDLDRSGHRVDDLGVLLNEADLVKFAKFAPTAGAATASMERARSVVLATTPAAPVETETAGATV